MLKPHKGDIYVDDKNLYKDSKKLIKSWRKGVSLVSQDIYLLDKSIKENISLTNDPNLINNKKLNKVLSLAELNKFKKKLKRGVDSKVGERGIWLSGGQKQRIGIARGFYKDSNLIILDEATSALDENTQKKILSNLNREFKDKTIIMISHRLSTLKICDEIYEIKNGKLNVVDIDKILMK